MATPEMIKKVDSLDSNATAFFRGYVQALGFTGRGELEGVDHSEDSYDLSAFEGSGDFDQNWDVWEEIQNHIADDDLQQIIDDCTAFIESAETLIDGDDDKPGEYESAGTDFSFTRNGHGAGFWDGDWANGGELTKLAKPFGTFDLTVVRNSDDEIVGVYCGG
jgi:hypothetical protein